MKSILLKFSGDAPIYFINTESKMYKPNTVFSVEAQVDGYVVPQISCLSGVSTFISVILPALREGGTDNVLDLCQEMFSSIARFNRDKIESIKITDQIELGVLSMKTEAFDLFDPQHFSVNIGAFGIYDLLSDYSDTSLSEVYRFLCKLKAETKITETNHKQTIYLSHPPRKSGIFRTYQYFRTLENVDENWQPPVNWTSPMPFQLDIDERLKWEVRLHEIFDGGYVSRFSLSTPDAFADFVRKILETDVLFFKVDLKNNNR
jgi:hypothetical protein